MTSITRNLTAAIAPLLFAPGLYAQVAPAAQSEAEKRGVDLLENKANDESAFEFSYAAPGSPVLPLLGVAGPVLVPDLPDELDCDWSGQGRDVEVHQLGRSQFPLLRTHSVR